jgi:hypothetical protein
MRILQQCRVAIPPDIIDDLAHCWFDFVEARAAIL